MKPTDADSTEQADPAGREPRYFGEALLNRVRDVARRIADRVRRVAQEGQEDAEGCDPHTP
jgi:hypothetical protein